MTLKLELKDLPPRSRQLSVSEIDQMLGGGSKNKGKECSLTADCKCGLSCCINGYSKAECIAVGIFSLGTLDYVPFKGKVCT